MLTHAWTKLRYHEQQSRLWRESSKICVVAAGRGSGKTMLAKRRVVRFLPVKKRWSDPLYFYALPTRQQAKRVAWEDIKRLVPSHWLAREPYESDMVIKTKFGSELHVVGADKPQRIEGNQWDGGVSDESSDQKPGFFTRSVQPALTHRNGWFWAVGVPKRTGSGAKDFKALFDLGLKENTGVASYTWPSSTVLSPEQLKWALDNLDVKDFEEQYNASWQSISGLIFHAFSEVENVTRDAVYNNSLPIIVSSDFNVDPMAWVLCHAVHGELVQFDEMFMRNCHTQMALNALYAKYGQHEAGFIFTGDATSKARKTSAPAVTDLILIKNDDRFKNKRMAYTKSNPPVRSRFAACNALMCNAAGVRRYFIHPKCVNTITDLSARAYKAGTNEPDDYGDIGHITDALGYAIYKFFPIRLNTTETQKVFAQ